MAKSLNNQTNASVTDSLTTETHCTPRFSRGQCAPIYVTLENVQMQFRITIAPDKDHPDRLVAYYTAPDGETYGMASIANAALSNPEVNKAWMELVRLVSTEFFTRMGFNVTRFDVIDQADLN